ncbi:thiamine pyrophosphate-dependent enzyme, partial [Agathobaculum sp.]|uniref:thiamine pyrophosphate-dependent enzyme n=1 Tax=Agathobaculum sp. TaxID=2048138 RepID=UPI002A827250
LPMVMNVACRTVSGPLSIKGDHSDIMYCLNTGWVILFADTPQAVYDFNLCALKVAERVKLPVIVAFDGFFTSHQKRRCQVLENDADVRAFVGEYQADYTALDPENPVTIGSYMNEPDTLNNKYQLHLAMEQARSVIREVWAEYEGLTGRSYGAVEGYRADDADTLLVLLGSSFHTAKDAVDRLRGQGKKCGAVTLHQLRPFPADALAHLCGGAEIIMIGDRQDSYGAGGGNLSLETRAALQTAGSTAKVMSRVYGLGGRDFYIEDAEELLRACYDEGAPRFDYTGVYPGDPSLRVEKLFEPVCGERAAPGTTTCEADPNTGRLTVRGGRVNETTAVPKRLAPGHGACPGCGIPVNLNLLLRGIEGNVVLLFQTGCGMVVSTGYPKTAFKTPYVHNLFQNGAATLSGLVEMYRQRQKRGELPEGDITFIMVSGDGGMDIGLGSALGTALRGSSLILFEYDNGGYMNTGYQLSYSTPLGAKSATSHLGAGQRGKTFPHKDTPMLFAATGIPYIATAAESNPADFIKKAAKAQYYAKQGNVAYIKTLSACPLNWGDKPNTERRVIAAGVDCCYFPLFEIENGVTTLSYDPEKTGKKTPVTAWLGMMGRTKHLAGERYADVASAFQDEVDRRWRALKARAEAEGL